MEDLKFTKEIKEKWLTALKSGEYIQGTIVLEENGQHCCLGVLAEIHPLLQISKEGDSCIYNGKYADYEPFNELLTEKTSDELWELNDRLKDNQRKDYSNVIQFIEKIETVD